MGINVDPNSNPNLNPKSPPEDVQKLVKALLSLIYGLFLLTLFALGTMLTIIGIYQLPHPYDYLVSGPILVIGSFILLQKA